MKKLVLYAEDDADDREWINEAHEALDSRFMIAFVEDGKELLKYLQLLYPDRYPALIVLDLNMPHMDGRQTLQKLKENPHFQQIPVAILTTSSNNVDREACKHLGASLFLVKPVSCIEWESIIYQLTELAL